MIDSRGVFYILLLSFSVIMAAPGFSQPPGIVDQPQMAQNNQTGQQGGQAGGQVQQGPGGQQGQGFGQGPGQGQQPEQMQNMVSQSLKQKLGSTDEEWAVIGPKLLKVISLVSSQSSGFQMRSLIGRSGNQGNMQARGTDNRASTSAGDKTVEELQTLLASEDTTTTQIKNKISEVRKEKEQARQDLVKAQKELRELLTLKQEAILISVGLLE